MSKETEDQIVAKCIAAFKSGRNPNKVPKRWLGAFRMGHRAAVKDFIDEDLSFQLLRRIIMSGFKDKEAMEQLDYITKFNNEYHKNVIKKGDKNALHNTEELRKDCYQRDNARRRDLMSVERESIVSISPKETQTNHGEITTDTLSVLVIDHNHEDTVIELLDYKIAQERKEKDKASKYTTSK